MSEGGAIETERLVLRRWQARDREPFAAMNADLLVMDEDAVLSRAESCELIDLFEERWCVAGFAFAAAERKSDGAFVGMVGIQCFDLALPFCPCVEIGWRLPRQLWGQGYATEAARGWLGHGFGAMGLDEIVAIVVPDNHRSRAVIRRLGMVRDPARDFDHSALPAGHRLRPHLLHALPRAAWAG